MCLTLLSISCRFLVNLSGIEFFADLTIEQRAEWLLANRTEGAEWHLHHLKPAVRVQLLSAGERDSSAFHTISEEQLNSLLMEEQQLTAVELLDMMSADTSAPAGKSSSKVTPKLLANGAPKKEKPRRKLALLADWWSLDSKNTKSGDQWIPLYPLASRHKDPVQLQTLEENQMPTSSGLQ